MIKQKLDSKFEDILSKVNYCDRKISSSYDKALEEIIEIFNKLLPSQYRADSRSIVNDINSVYSTPSIPIVVYSLYDELPPSEYDIINQRNIIPKKYVRAYFNFMSEDEHRKKIYLYEAIKKIKFSSIEFDQIVFSGIIYNETFCCDPEHGVYCFGCAVDSLSETWRGEEKYKSKRLIELEKRNAIDIFCNLGNGNLIKVLDPDYDYIATFDKYPLKGLMRQLFYHLQKMESKSHETCIN